LGKGPNLLVCLSCRLGIWENTNWSGACDAEAKLAKPTLVITGTDDKDYMPHGNSLKIAEKIPGAWLVQIKNASHAVISQYPEKVGKIMNTFLSTTGQSSCLIN
jgi:pimeloyl-ACP methyl ester carboxylesterase